MLKNHANGVRSQPSQVVGLSNIPTQAADQLLEFVFFLSPADTKQAESREVRIPYGSSQLPREKETEAFLKRIAGNFLSLSRINSQPPSGL